MGIPWQNYRVSLAIWDHTVLPATRHKRTHPALTPGPGSALLLHILAIYVSKIRHFWPSDMIQYDMISLTCAKKEKHKGCRISNLFHRGRCRPWPTQYSVLMGHDAIGPPNRPNYLNFSFFLQVKMSFILNAKIVLCAFCRTVFDISLLSTER